MSNLSNDASRAGAPVRLRASIAAKRFTTQTGEPRLALENVAFEVREGEVAALVGPSGCGKSTLMRIVAGLETAFDGRVERDVAATLGVAFQEPRLLPWRSARDNLRIAAPRASEAEVDALFARFGVAEHGDHLPGELSLGLARRVALARAFAVRPRLLLLDEPFASLDEATRAQCCDAVAALIEAERIAALIITHDIDAAIRLADVIHVLSPRPGRLLKSVPIATPRRVDAEQSRALRRAVGTFS